MGTKIASRKTGRENVLNLHIEVNALQLCRWQCSNKETLRSELPISVNWTFFARCYGWGAMSEYRLKIGVLALAGPVWSKIWGRGLEGVAPTNHSSCQKTTMNDLSCGIRMWADLFFTALHVMQTRYCDENSVRLSVCLSDAWFVTKWKKGRSRFLYHTKEHLA